MAEIAGKYSGAPCFVMRVEEMTFVQCFEGIWACASLLHAPKDILPIALHRIHDALTPNGIMFASVQEGEGEGKAHDGRFFAYYQFQEFKAVVSDADFAIESAWENEDALGRPSQFRWLNVIARRRG